MECCPTSRAVPGSPLMTGILLLVVFRPSPMALAQLSQPATAPAAESLGSTGATPARASSVPAQGPADAPKQYSDAWWTLQFDIMRSAPGVNETLLTACTDNNNTEALVPQSCTGKLANYSLNLQVNGSTGTFLKATSIVCDVPEQNLRVCRLSTAWDSPKSVLTVGRRALSRSQCCTSTSHTLHTAGDNDNIRGCINSMKLSPAIL